MTELMENLDQFVLDPAPQVGQTINIYLYNKLYFEFIGTSTFNSIESLSSKVELKLLNLLFFEESCCVVLQRRF